MIIRSKWKTYCYRCYFTIWANEKIELKNKPFHLDCKTALLDETPRQLNPRYIGTCGRISKKKMKKCLSQR